jgi:hypothetical protein
MTPGCVWAVIRQGAEFRGRDQVSFRQCDRAAGGVCRVKAIIGDVRNPREERPPRI